RVDGEFAVRATGSDFSYWRLVAELSEYRELVPGLVLALRARPGFVKALTEPAAGLGVHPLKRFFTGGPNSVRGYAQYQLGPKVLTIDAARFLWADSVSSPPRGICSKAMIADSTCNVSKLPSSMFDVRPTGGQAMLEGNIELRFPLAMSGKLRGVTFLDYGQLFSTASDFQLRQLVWTPGFGVRYFSAIGPIRVDVGYRPQGSETLEVLTTNVGRRLADGSVDCSLDPGDGNHVANCGDLRPLKTRLEWPPNPGFFDHLQVHFSIGQAF
ncbi:MAG TPA: BamA/TamA family outer membrane protein, partial [Longimicrobiales bacterium]